MISYLSGGYQHTQADRDQADAIERACPSVRPMLKDTQLFAGRAAAWAAAQGITRIIDLGAGFPAAASIHHAAAGARVTYVTGDPEVADAWDVYLGEHPEPRVTVVCADFADPDAVLGDPALKDAAGAPLCLLFSLALNVMAPGKARRLAGGWVRRAAAGSVVAICCPRIDDPVMQQRVAAAWPGWNFTRGQFAALFGGLELVPPGIAPAARLRPGWAAVPERSPGPAYVIAGIGLTR